MSTTIETKYDVGDIVTLTNVGSAPVRSYPILGFKIYYDTGEPYGVIEESRLEGKVTLQCQHQTSRKEFWIWVIAEMRTGEGYRRLYCPDCGECLNESLEKDE